MINNGLKEYQDKLKAGEVTIERKSPAQKARDKPKSLRLAINAKCYDCTCDSKIEVTNCEITDCSLWSVRPWQRRK